MLIGVPLYILSLSYSLRLLTLLWNESLCKIWKDAVLNFWILIPMYNLWAGSNYWQTTMAQSTTHELQNNTIFLYKQCWNGNILHYSQRKSTATERLIVSHSFSWRMQSDETLFAQDIKVASGSRLFFYSQLHNYSYTQPDFSWLQSLLHWLCWHTVFSSQ